MIRGDIMIFSLKDKVKEYVEIAKDQVDVQFRDDLNLPDLPVNPRTSTGIHYLLLIASINQQANATHIRFFGKRLWEMAGNSLLSRDGGGLKFIEDALEKENNEGRLIGWRFINKVSRVIFDVNKFVSGIAGGDLLEWGKKQKDVNEVIDKIATSIYYMGRSPDGARKKAWMFMRWMVRPTPDLGVWNHLGPKNLMIPVDRNVMKFAKDTGIKGLSERSPNANDRRLITEFAKLIFPEDPACVDYPFFIYGRGKNRMGNDTCFSVVSCKKCPLRGFMPCSPIM